ncbi:asparagine synthase-related protein [Streptomyces sp. NPDC018833]|uniref:asparagine synthase-related protein n=1 Tax=Streptomyces sp. NPDC018833 TaxID=3365053 RepID=UPI0037A4BC54
MIDRLARFRDGSGHTAVDPLVLAGPVPGVDLHSVGLLMAPPALSGEFMPVSMWRGIERLDPEPVIPSLRPDGLRAAFTEAVREMTATAQVIGVKVSGGLDSLATLVHACDVAEGRRVVAFAIDMTDDQGGSSVTEVQRLMRALNLNAELVVLSPEHDRAEPQWSPIGPRFDGMPEVNAAAAERAAALGVDVLLSGDGSDELLGVPRYATGAVAARHGIRAAMRYSRDAARGGPGLFGEAAALVSRFLPARARAQTYWAMNWPEWSSPVATAVLAEPYRTEATKWARAWVREQIVEHAVAHRTWVEADAFDALYPYTPMPPAGDIPEGSPFLHPSFLAAALALPLADRYRSDLPSAYWRYKAQVIDLLPGAMAKLPPRKQYFTSALARQAATLDTSKQLLVSEVGLVDPDQLAREKDTGVLLYVAAIERWLAGAVRCGAQIL